VFGKNNTYNHLHSVEATLSNANITTAPVTRALSGTAPDMKAGAIEAAIDHSEKNLKHIADVRTSLVIQTLKESSNDKTRDAIMTAGNMLGLGLGPSPSAGYTKTVTSAVEYTSTHSGFEHAGLQHAALGGGKSSFQPLSSSDGEGRKSKHYTDALGGEWTWGGQPAPPPQLQFTNPSDFEFNAGLLKSAGRIVDAHGRDKVLEDLKVETNAEKRLNKQDGAARNLAREEFGVDMPNPNKPMMLSGPKPPGFFH
jgi:hypothetical protein